MTSLAPSASRAWKLAGPATRRCFSTSKSLQTTYGFIGLGRMGYPMCMNLRAKIPSSDEIIIHDVNPQVTAKFCSEHKQGVHIAQNVREVAEKSETIITVLPAPHHVQNVFGNMLRPPTLLKTEVGEPRLFIDCSTIDPRSSAEVANATHSSAQGKFVDAPMSGGTVAANSGKLTFMVGASERSFARAKEVLALMGGRIVHLGPQTSGLKGKLANNYLLAISNIATAEAMNMGIKWGLDPIALGDMINSSSGRCWPSEINNPVTGISKGSPAERDYDGGFGTSLMNKDLSLAMKAAEEIGIEPRLGPVARTIYNMVENNEATKGRDFSVVYRWLGGKE